MELKKCPFCGKLPEIFPNNPELSGSVWGEVKCTNIKCPARPSVFDGISLADNRGSDLYKKAAVKRWNTRYED